ncbi:MAG: acyltransferase [Hyphomicrobiales bacterium]|nr:MAG: acyltransferase [Hyphomicrobiales bacterium]
MRAHTARIDWVDAARGIGILLVVFGHVWRGLWESSLLTDEPLFVAIDTAIYLFHMPLFFLVSGMFFEKSALRDGFLGSLFKRCETLLFPLLIWSWVFAAFLLMSGGFTSRGSLTPMEALLYPFPPQDIFWFLWALFLIQMFSLLLLRMTDRTLVVVFLASLALTMLQPEIPGTALLGGFFKGLPFFLAGVLLTRRDLFGPQPVRSAAAVGTGVFALSILCAVAFGLQGGALGTLLSLVAALGFCAMIYGLAPRLPPRLLAILTFLGATSMAIYVMHIAPEAAARIVLVHLGLDALWIQLLGGMLGGVLVPLAAYQCFKRLGLLRAFGLGRDRPGKELPLSHGQAPSSASP